MHISTTLLTISHLNCRSIRNKGTDLHLIITTSQTDIVLLTETHLNPTVKNAEFIDTSIYTIYRNDRDDGWGGILIAVKNEIAPYTQLHFQDRDILSITLKNKGQCVHICCFYRPPSEVGHMCITNYLTEIHKGNINNNGNPYVVMGNFNLPAIDWKTKTIKPGALQSNLPKDFLDIIEEYSLIQLASKATHIKRKCTRPNSNK